MSKQKKAATAAQFTFEQKNPPKSKSVFLNWVGGGGAENLQFAISSKIGEDYRGKAFDGDKIAHTQKYYPQSG